MGKNFRFYIALYVAKILIIACHLFKSGGTTLPGRVAIKICPDFIGRIGKPEKIICVTGTNGKTTVSNMLNDCLDKCGYRVLNNREGGNIHYGVASTLAGGSNFLGNTKYNYAVLEIDERSSIRIFPYLKPDFLVVTNLFRDSIYRNAHTEYILDILKSELPKSTKLILNADDLIASRLAENGNDAVYFGIDKLESDGDELNSNIVDIRTCPKCHSKLVFDFVRYHHIGRAHCPNCDFKSKVADYRVCNIDLEKMEIDLLYQNEHYTFKISSDNIINIYNVLTAISCLHEFGISFEELQKTFTNLKVVESRLETKKCGDVEIILQVAKGLNPVAISRAFAYINACEGQKVIFMNLDDYYKQKHGESENVSWLYDADFELLKDDSIKQIIIGGIRAKDYLTRCLIAGIEKDKIFIEDDYHDEVKNLKLENIDKVFILHDIFNKFIADYLADEVINEIKKEVK